MSIFIKHVVIQKLKQLKASELLAHAKEHDFPITDEEADRIVDYLKTADIDPFHAAGRMEMIKKLAAITSPAIAKNANELFLELIRANGVEHLFK